MKKIELESMSDIAYLASSSHSGIIQHYKGKSGDNVYFLVGGTMNETIIFYVKDEEIRKRFIIFNAMKNKVEYTNSPILDPKLKIIPIIEVKTQNILESEI
jgi:hypothetical protein